MTNWYHRSIRRSTKIPMTPSPSTTKPSSGLRRWVGSWAGAWSRVTSSRRVNRRKRRGARAGSGWCFWGARRENGIREGEEERELEKDDVERDLIKEVKSSQRMEKGRREK